MSLEHKEAARLMAEHDAALEEGDLRGARFCALTALAVLMDAGKRTTKQPDRALVSYQAAYLAARCRLGDLSSKLVGLGAQGAPEALLAQLEGLLEEPPEPSEAFHVEPVIKMSWKEDEDALIREAWSEGMTWEMLATLLGRTVSAVKQRIRRLQVPETRKPGGALHGYEWTPERVEQLRRLRYDEGLPQREIALEMGISVTRVQQGYRALRRLGIEKPEPQLAPKLAPKLGVRWW